MGSRDARPNPQARLLNRLRAFASAVAATMFAAMFVLFAYKIVRRYAFGDAAAWADELCVILFVWIIFWGSAFLVRPREQIVFDLAYNAVPASVKRGFAIGRAVLIGGLFAAALPTIVGYLAFLTQTKTAVLRWPIGWVYACFGILVAAMVARSAVEVARLCQADWRTRI